MADHLTERAEGKGRGIGTFWANTWTQRWLTPAKLYGVVAVHYALPDDGLRVVVSHAPSGWKFADFPVLSRATSAAKELADTFTYDGEDPCVARDMLVLADVHEIVKRHGGNIGQGHLTCDRLLHYHHKAPGADR